MNANTFIDTNILIYAFTEDEPKKREMALSHLDNCFPFVSTQVIKEFVNVLLKKTSLDISIIKTVIDDICDTTKVINEEVGFVSNALDIKSRYNYRFYDSLIISAALNSKCSILLSEDLQDGQIIDGTLKIVNPFML